MRVSLAAANARCRRPPGKIRVVLRDFDVDDFGIARAPAAQFMAYRPGVVLVVEPLLALMISGP